MPMLETFKRVKEGDAEALASWPDPWDRFEVRRNQLGRNLIVGPLFGVIRVITSIAQISFALIRSFLYLLLAGMNSMFNQKLAIKELKNIADNGRLALSAVKDIGRGIVEIVPVVGALILASYDFGNYTSGSMYRNSISRHKIKF